MCCTHLPILVDIIQYYHGAFCQYCQFYNEYARLGNTYLTHGKYEVWKSEQHDIARTERIFKSLVKEKEADRESGGAVSGLVNVITGYLQVMGQSITVLSIDFPSLVSGLFEVLSWFTLPVASFMGA